MSETGRPNAECVADGHRSIGPPPGERVGHADPLHWAVSRFCGDLLWGVEDNRSVAGLLEQDLLSCGIKVRRGRTIPSL